MRSCSGASRLLAFVVMMAKDLIVALNVDDGTRPHRIKVRIRWALSTTTTGSFVVGAAFQRGWYWPISSTSIFRSILISETSSGSLARPHIGKLLGNSCGFQ